MCNAFATLNEGIAILLKELELLGKHSDDELELRKDAIVSCTSRVMSEVFEGHDSNEVMYLIKAATSNSRKEMLANMEHILKMINNPN